MLRAYDLLLLMDVIEHVEDDLEFIRVSLEHLKPGGIIAINVPAHMKLYSRYDEVAGHNAVTVSVTLECCLVKRM